MNGLKQTSVDQGGPIKLDRDVYLMVILAVVMVAAAGKLVSHLVLPEADSVNQVETVATNQTSESRDDAVEALESPRVSVAELAPQTSAANKAPEVQQEQPLAVVPEESVVRREQRADFLRQVLGMGETQVEAIMQQFDHHAAEIEVYKSQLKSGDSSAQAKIVEAGKEHHEWMVDHMGEEDYMRLLEGTKSAPR